MASTTPTTFTCFPKLPLELQKMSWEAAAADLPVLDFQRFTAEITLTERNADSEKPQRLLLCFTPHADFINITTGHRGLLGACLESRKAAQKQIDCLLPIHYLTTDATGSLVPRQGSVPFNFSGHFCVSGLGLAIKEATEGRGARGSKLLHSHRASCIVKKIQGREEVTSLIKNLTIVLGSAQGEFDEGQYIFGADDMIFDLIASRMPKLKTVSLISDVILNRRNHLDQEDFNDLHQICNLIPKSKVVREVRTFYWCFLWFKWCFKQTTFFRL